MSQIFSGHFYIISIWSGDIHERRLALQEQGPDEDHIYNCHVIVDDKGDIVAEYRKIHLFDVNIPGGAILMESGFTSPGSKFVTCNSPAGKLGLSVCYDLRFPQLYQKLVFEMGANVLLVSDGFVRGEHSFFGCA